MSRRIKLIKAAKLMSLISFKLSGKMRENKVRKDEKRKRHFMILMKVAQFDEFRTKARHYTSAKHHIAKSACVHLFDATLEFDATELNATFKSVVAFCHITV